MGYLGRGLLGYCDFTDLGLRFGLDFVVWFALFSGGLVVMGGWLVAICCFVDWFSA